MPIKHSTSDQASPFSNNVGSALVAIPSTGRPIGGLQLDLSAFNTETHTYEGRAASERPDATRDEVAHA
jgi:hypothetical protein